MFLWLLFMGENTMIFLRVSKLLLVVLLLTSCALLQPKLQEVKIPPKRFILKGFSFMPFNEKGWLILTQRNTRVDLFKKGTNQNESFVITAISLKDIPIYKSSDEFIRFIKKAESKADHANSERFKVLKHEVISYKERGNNCVRSHSVAEDHAAAKRTKVAGHMILEKAALYCYFPAGNQTGSHFEYSHRYNLGQNNKEFLEKATRILDTYEIIHH